MVLRNSATTVQTEASDVGRVQKFNPYLLNKVTSTCYHAAKKDKEIPTSLKSNHRLVSPPLPPKMVKNQVYHVKKVFSYPVPNTLNLEQTKELFSIFRAHPSKGMKIFIQQFFPGSNPEQIANILCLFTILTKDHLAHFLNANSQLSRQCLEFIVNHMNFAGANRFDSLNGYLSIFSIEPEKKPDSCLSPSSCKKIISQTDSFYGFQYEQLKTAFDLQFRRCNRSVSKSQLKQSRKIRLEIPRFKIVAPDMNYRLCVYGNISKSDSKKTKELFKKFSKSHTMDIPLLISNFVKLYFPESNLVYVSQLLVLFSTLSRLSISRFLSEDKILNHSCLKFVCQHFNFKNLPIDRSLKKFKSYISFTDDLKKVDQNRVATLLSEFAFRYLECNKSTTWGQNFQDKHDSIIVLASGCMLLNNEFRCTNGGKMSLKEFVLWVRGNNGGDYLDLDMLKGVYNRIKNRDMNSR